VINLDVDIGMVKELLSLFCSLMKKEESE